MPRFCAYCGAAIGRPAPVVCSACGREHWLKATGEAPRSWSTTAGCC